MRIAIIGTGQLARMLAFAGMRLGFSCSFLAQCQEDTHCVEGLGTVVRAGSWSEPETLLQQLGNPDVITVEKEQIDIELLHRLHPNTSIHPNPNAFLTCSDRWREKQCLNALDIPNAPHVFLPSVEHATRVDPELPFPIIAKSTRQAYDGRNQVLIPDRRALEEFSVSRRPGQWIMEQKIAFDREVSLITVRAQNGDIAFYPITENHHRDGILVSSISPAPAVTSVFKETLQNYAKTLINGLDYVGVMAMECFVVGDDVLVNEIAPRVHNSGHWTAAGSVTCQFENHLRAISGLQLGATSTPQAAGMINLIGQEQPPVHCLDTHSSLHWYNKTARPGRKVGHVNFRNTSMANLLQDMARFNKKLQISAGDCPG